MRFDYIIETPCETPSGGVTTTTGSDVTSTTGGDVSTTTGGDVSTTTGSDVTTTTGGDVTTTTGSGSFCLECELSYILDATSIGGGVFVLTRPAGVCTWTFADTEGDGTVYSIFIQGDRWGLDVTAPLGPATYLKDVPIPPDATAPADCPQGNYDSGIVVT